MLRVGRLLLMCDIRMIYDEVKEGRDFLIFSVGNPLGLYKVQQYIGGK